MELEGPRTAIAAQLIDLEAALRQLNLWSDESPSQEALSSEQPFAMDSLEFEEWLQTQPAGTATGGQACFRQRGAQTRNT